jgi:sulfur relay (sulfurtransferase) complex TusBCD TusD component (DsrE family)
MKIGILLLTSPEHENTDTVHRLCQGFIKQGHDVELFLMDDGVFNSIKSNSTIRLAQPLEGLIEQGVQISLCSQTLDQRGLSKDNLVQGVDLSNQQRLAKMVAQADRFLVFG